MKIRHDREADALRITFNIVALEILAVSKNVDEPNTHPRYDQKKTPHPTSPQP